MESKLKNTQNKLNNKGVVLVDPYFKKYIEYEGIKFNVANTLFSTFRIDLGSEVLLRNIETGKPNRILDIGCGYGVLGLMLANKYPNAEVVFLDKDLLAVRYTQLNASANGLVNVEAHGSVGIEAVSDKKFDLIVSNVPAKIGDSAIEEEFILKPLRILNEGGEYWIVVVTALNRLIPKIGRKNDLNLKEIKKRHGHSVYRIRK